MANEKYNEISGKVESLINEISEVKGSAVIMIAIDDPETDGKNSTTAMVGKKGDLIDMIAHAANHPEGLQIANVIADGLLIGAVMGHKKGHNEAKEETEKPSAE